MIVKKKFIYFHFYHYIYGMYKSFMYNLITIKFFQALISNHKCA